MRFPIFSIAHLIAFAAWAANVWMLWRGQGIRVFFGTQAGEWSDPMSLLVAALTTIVLWLLVRRLRQGILRGRATLWSSISGLVFVSIGGMLAVKYSEQIALWSAPIVLGLSLWVLALEPFLVGED